MMKKYEKPTIEITAFRTQENIASTSIFEYSDGNSVPVTMYDVTTSSWNGGEAS